MKKVCIRILIIIVIVAMCTLCLSACDGLFGGKKPAIEQLHISGSKSFKISSPLSLEVEVVPDNASKKGITFAIDETVTSAPGARIINDCLYADGEGVIGVVAQAKNGVKSEITLISAQKEPVVSVVNTNDSKIRFVELEQFDRAHSMSETNWNSSGNVEYITNDQNAMSGRGMIGLRAQNAGIYRTFELKPYETVSIKFYTSNRSVDSYKSYYIVKLYEDGVWRDYGNTLTCNVGDWKECKPVEYKNDSSVKKSITIGFFRTNGSSLFVNPTVFIDDITVNIITQYPFMREGTQLTLKCEVSPFNATYKDITYQIVSNGTTAQGARIVDGILYADSCGYVKIYAIADGVYSEPFIIEVI